jgi:hypothetical protein
MAAAATHVVPPYKLTDLMNVWAQHWAFRKKRNLDWIALSEDEIRERLLHSYCSGYGGSELLKHYPPYYVERAEFSDSDVRMSTTPEPDSNTIRSNMVFKKITNRTSEPMMHKITAKKAWQEQKIKTETTSITFTSTIGLTVGFPGFGNLNTAVAVALSKLWTTQTTETHTDEIGDESSITLPPGAKIIIKNIYKERIGKSRVSCSTYLQGHLVIALKTKTLHTPSTRPDAEHPHRKWPIPIKEVFSNLLNNEWLEGMDPEVKAAVAATLSAFKITPESIGDSRVRLVLEDEVPKAIYVGGELDFGMTNALGEIIAIAPTMIHPRATTAPTTAISTATVIDRAASASGLLIARDATLAISGGTGLRITGGSATNPTETAPESTNDSAVIELTGGGAAIGDRSRVAVIPGDIPTLNPSVQALAAAFLGATQTATATSSATVGK